MSILLEVLSPFVASIDHGVEDSTVKPVCNGHLYNKIHYLWFMQ